MTFLNLNFVWIRKSKNLELVGLRLLIDPQQRNWLIFASPPLFLTMQNVIIFVCGLVWVAKNAFPLRFGNFQRILGSFRDFQPTNSYPLHIYISLFFFSKGCSGIVRSPFGILWWFFDVSLPACISSHTPFDILFFKNFIILKDPHRRGRIFRDCSTL